MFGLNNIVQRSKYVKSLKLVYVLAFDAAFFSPLSRISIIENICNNL